MDRTLLRIVTDMPEATWADRASTMSAEVQHPVTEDMMRNRHKRMQQDIELSRITPPVQNAIEIPPVPEGDFVGFTMAFFDIETDGLSAWNHEMTCASITDNFGKTYHRTKFDFKQSSVLDDKGLVVWLRDELEKYDILVGWYGSMFDLPFINAKLLEYGERPVRDIMFLDPCFKTRGGRYGIKVGSSKLKNVAKFFSTATQKPEVEWSTFKLAAIGDPEALAEVVVRCDDDTKAMREIVHHLKPMIRTLHR
jgi:uncharacterized protein YprB with RNaseH-like and TPR domain